MADEVRPTFAQREGAAAIPGQLKPREISEQLRAMLWAAFLKDFQKVCGSEYIFHHWETMLRDYHVEVLCRMPDLFSQNSASHRYFLGNTFKTGNYVAVLDLTEWLLRHPKLPEAVRTEVMRAFVISRSAYRVIDRDTIIGLTEGQEAASLTQALAGTATAGEFAGVRAHLKNAAHEMRNGRFPESVRESIHAVEAVTQVLEPEAAGFAHALSKLEVTFKLHGALKAGFAALYGFTSDAKGIRHSLGQVAEADVDEPLAIYMLGTCSSFINLLVSKARMK